MSLNKDPKGHHLKRELVNLNYFKPNELIYQTNNTVDNNNRYLNTQPDSYIPNLNNLNSLSNHENKFQNSVNIPRITRHDNLNYSKENKLYDLHKSQELSRSHLLANNSYNIKANSNQDKDFFLKDAEQIRIKNFIMNRQVDKNSEIQYNGNADSNLNLNTENGNQNMMKNTNSVTNVFNKPNEINDSYVRNTYLVGSPYYNGSVNKIYSIHKLDYTNDIGFDRNNFFTDNSGSLKEIKSKKRTYLNEGRPIDSPKPLPIHLNNQSYSLNKYNNNDNRTNSIYENSTGITYTNNNENSEFQGNPDVYSDVRYLLSINFN